MKDITLCDGSMLHLPTEWGELTGEQLLRAMDMLPFVVAGEMEPFDFQLQMLLMITGYRPDRRRLWRRLRRAWLWLTNPIEAMAQKELDRLRSEYVTCNLVRLAESLNFAFELNGSELKLNYYFTDNPFADMVKDAARFTRRMTVETNMTARQFSDGVDLLSNLKSDDTPEFHTHILRRLSAVLYNLSYDETAGLPGAVLFGTSLWFTGVVQYFKEHPVYGMLFRKSESGTSSGGGIALGMGEVILSLEKSGYHNVAAMNLLEFMDAQIKLIKDNVAKAAAEGVKAGEIASRSGLSIADVIKMI
ncbi:MAG: hypothetical protein II708_01490 [Paludibacteraceae bacterium]|nr:hypothetical protein [Paludibacteraceae bacterium]MBQ3929603.1 hypothetical protein [Paludibacteraceae bacterium]